MRRYPALWARLFTRPLQAEPYAAAAVVAALADRLGVASVEVPDGETSYVLDVAALASAGQDTIRRAREYRVQDGMAVIPVIGELVTRSDVLEPQSGMTGYTAISRALDVALADSDVRGIALEIDSPGGEAGVHDLARQVREASAVKPVWAIVADQASSAAYAIASGAQRILAPAAGMLGSIGVIGLHADVSGALAQAGVKVTILSAGAHKADGNPFQALPPEVAADWKDKIDSIYGDFVKLVADHRGTTQKAVRGTEARVLMANQALDAGLVDEIVPVREAFAAFSEFLNRGAGSSVGRPARGAGMTAQLTGAAGSSAPDTELQPRLDAARAEGFAAGRAEGLAEGAKAERARVAAITARPEAQGREKAALSLALRSDMDAEAAGAVLADLPAAAPAQAAGPTPFEAAMTGLGNPRVGPDGAGGGTGDPAEEAAAGILKFASRRAS